MYAGVPITEPTSESLPLEPGPLRTVSISVRWSRSARFSSATPPRCSTFARPQSTTCTSPNAPTITFAGLRSRCSTPFECAYATVWQIDSKIASRRPRSSAGDFRCWKSDASVCPLTSFIVKYGRSSAISPSS